MEAYTDSNLIIRAIFAIMPDCIQNCTEAYNSFYTNSSDVTPMAPHSWIPNIRTNELEGCLMLCLKIPYKIDALLPWPGLVSRSQPD